MVQAARSKRKQFEKERSCHSANVLPNTKARLRESVWTIVSNICN